MLFSLGVFASTFCFAALPRFLAAVSDVLSPIHCPRSIADDTFGMTVNFPTAYTDNALHIDRMLLSLIKPH